MATAHSLDLSEPTGFPVQVDDGRYIMECVSVEDYISKADKPMWLFRFVCPEIEEGLYAHYVSLDPKSSFRVREIFSAAGFKLPRGKGVTVDPNVLVGKTFGVELKAEEFNDRWSSKIVSLFKVSPGDVMPPRTPHVPVERSHEVSVTQPSCDSDGITIDEW